MVLFPKAPLPLRDDHRIIGSSKTRLWTLCFRSHTDTDRHTHSSIVILSSPQNHTQSHSADRSIPSNWATIGRYFHAKHLIIGSFLLLIDTLHIQYQFAFFQGATTHIPSTIIKQIMHSFDRYVLFIMSSLPMLPPNHTIASRKSI